MQTIKKILTIDDESVQELIIRLLSRRADNQLACVFKNSGHEALEFLGHCPPESFPDVIFVDLYMPGMDGYEFIEQYEQQFFSGHPGTSIFVLSASINRHDQEEALKFASVRKFVTKPFTQHQFLELLEEADAR